MIRVYISAYALAWTMPPRARPAVSPHFAAAAQAMRRDAKIGNDAPGIQNANENLLAFSVPGAYALLSSALSAYNATMPRPAAMLLI